MYIKPPIPLKCLFIVDLFKDLYYESLFVFSRHDNNIHIRCCDYFYKTQLSLSYDGCFVGINQLFLWRM